MTICVAWFIMCSDGKAADEPANPKNLPNPILDRQKRIQDEIQKLGPDHDWAGKYDTGGGRGFNRTIILAPGGGIVYQEWGCLGIYDQFHGDISVKDRVIAIRWAAPKPESLLSDQLLVVQWGTRRYLMPPEELFLFGIDASPDRAPGKNDSAFSVLWRDSSNDPTSHARPQVKPIAPKSFERYLNLGHLKASIQSVGPVKVQKANDAQKRDCVTCAGVLPLGETHGVLPRMQFYGKRDSTKFYGQVTRVRDKECDVLIELVGYSDPAQATSKPEPGDVLTTDPWLHPSKW